TEADVEGATGLPVLAVVPSVQRQEPLRLSADEMKALGSGPGVKEAVLFTEAFRNLRVSLQLAGRAHRLATIMVASPFPGEGKSTVVVNLGLEFGETGQRVVLADTDFLRPSLHEQLQVRPAESGLVDLLHARQDVTQTLAPVKDHVWLATRGRSLQRETRGMLASERLKEVMVEMSGRADLVLCDSSPVLLVPETLFVAAAVDGVILVALAGVTAYRDLARAKTMLENAGARVLGVVINQMPVARLSRYYKHYYRGYYKQTA
ncbi:MAG TPA: CpsD/CapB family tyrosine-protein kinase, partial [Methylomirabilota bacterium]|nr:CpsD/CapB family tyrosine-protein kinase [Methylomirabilota bacterium]